MRKIAIVCPCYNEAKIIDEFLSQLAGVLSSLRFYQFVIIIVDDASTDETVNIIKKFSFKYTNAQLVLVLHEFNQGHQQAIYSGIRFAVTSSKADYVIIMDSDGEDDPKGIPKLLEIEKQEYIQVIRGRRREKAAFKIGYFIYKLLTKILIGKEINFGHYSIISSRIAKRIIEDGFVHYPAYLSKLRMNYSTVRLDRNRRIGGQSKMNTDRLVFHGLKAFVEYSEEILISFFKISIFIAILILTLTTYILFLKFSNQASPGWASNLIASLFNSFLTSIGILVLGLLILKNSMRTKGQTSYMEKSSTE